MKTIIKKIFSPRNLGAAIAILIVTAGTALAQIPAYKEWVVNGLNVYAGVGGKRVGIGTTNPTEKLQVAGTIHSTTGGFKFPDNTVQTTASSGGIGGGGTQGRIPLFTSPTTLGDSFIREWSSSVFIGAPSQVPVFMADVGFNQVSVFGGPGSPPPSIAGTLNVVDGDIGPTYGGGIGTWNPFQRVRTIITPEGIDQSFNFYDAGVFSTCGNGFGGQIVCRGGNSMNTLVSFPIGFPDRGYIAVLNQNWPTAPAGMYVDSSGTGIVFGNIKNFREPNPNDPNTEIWYASVEGPEAAAYIRGTARLINGTAVITLPDHFQAMAVETGMTIQLTPLSADSKGLAVTAKSLDGVSVRELSGGNGTYAFDWEVKAVRKGYENYRVIRPKDEVKPAAPAFLDKQVNIKPTKKSAQ